MMLDIIGMTLLVLLFFRGYRKGVIVALFSVVGLILGMICALKLSGALAAYLFEKGWVTSAWAQIISYILLFAGVILLIRLGARLVQRTFEAIMLGLVNRIAGGILYALIAAIIWSSCLWVADQAHLISPETKAGSVTYTRFQPVAPFVFARVGAVLPFARDVFSDLEHFFDGVNRRLPDHVGSH